MKKEFKISELRVEYDKGVETLFRKPTKQELSEALKLYNERMRLEKQIEKIEKQLEKVENSAKGSKVFYDRAGFTYDERTFIASGRTDLI
jgi:valyl-tRNA synthetase